MAGFVGKVGLLEVLAVAGFSVDVDKTVVAEGVSVCVDDVGQSLQSSQLVSAHGADQARRTTENANNISIDIL